MTSIRGEKRTEFPQSVRKKAFARCCINAVPHCESCGKPLRSGDIIYEHITPDGLQGEPTLENCKVHCRTCADIKTHEEDLPRMRKADRVLKRAFGLEPKRQKIKSGGFRKAPPQCRASSPINKWRGF